MKYDLHKGPSRGYEYRGPLSRGERAGSRYRAANIANSTSRIGVDEQREGLDPFLFGFNRMPIHHENLSVIMEIGGMRNIKGNDRWALSAQFVACTTYCLASQCIIHYLLSFLDLFIILLS